MGDHNLFYFRLLDYYCTGINSIIYSSIIYRIFIIYFSIQGRMVLIVRTDMYVVAWTFIKSQSDFRLCTLLELWTLIELEGVAIGLDKIPLLYQFLKLVVIGRAGHSNGLSDGFR